MPKAAPEFSRAVLRSRVHNRTRKSRRQAYSVSMAVGIAARLFKNSRRQGISLLNQNIALARSLARRHGRARGEFECYSRRRRMRMQGRPNRLALAK